MGKEKPKIGFAGTSGPNKEDVSEALGFNITVGPEPPQNPQEFDLWVDTSNNE